MPDPVVHVKDAGLPGKGESVKFDV
jgi:hypothetical protein